MIPCRRQTDNQTKHNAKRFSFTVSYFLQFSQKVLELARKQRMNTEIRRNIFCVLMTSEDYLDAFEKLLRFVRLTYFSFHAVNIAKEKHDLLFFLQVGKRKAKLFFLWSFSFYEAFFFLVKDGSEGQAGERDRPRSDELLPAGEIIQRILRGSRREILLPRSTLSGTNKRKHVI